MSNNKKKSENINHKKPKNTIQKGTMKRLLKYIAQGNKIKLGIIFICIIFSSVANVIGSLFLKRLIDDYITPLLRVSNPVFTELFHAISIMIIIYGAGILGTYLYNFLMASLSQGVLKNIRNELFSKMQGLPIKFFDTNTHGSIMSYYTNDVDTVEQVISQGLPQFINSAFSITATLVSMIYLSKTLTCFVILFTFLTISVTKRIAMKSAKYFVRQQDSISKVNGYIEEMLNGQKVIKVFTHEKKAKEKFDKLNDQLNHDMYKANKYANIMMPIANNLGNFQYVCIAIIGTLLALNGKQALTVGTIVSFLQLARSFTQPINQFMNQINSVVMALAGASRIFKLMDEAPEIDEGKVTLVNIKKQGDNIIETKENTKLWAWKKINDSSEVEYTELKGYIVLEDVNFSYDGKKDTLKDINIYAKPGQKIAFVGATGAGKTTITNLINRFYDIKDGKILYDGIDIKEIKKSDLRKSLGMVLQDTNLFTGTIKENIKYGNEDATDDEVIQAAKLANAHSFIKRLPEGYDTVLTENGSQLSQGQRQLLSIARAAVNDPPVMILDEATSSIDTRTEKIVQDGMDKLTQGRTVFVIAHRSSTVRDSKAIMVMDHGEIIERGNHEQLIDQKGQYYQLYTGAFELE